MKNIYKIALTGVAYAKKAKLAEYLSSHFSQKGFCTFVVPVATSSFMGEQPTPLCKDTESFQSALSTIIANEAAAQQAAQQAAEENVLIICTEAKMSIRAALTNEQFESLGVSVINLRDSYDAVFHIKLLQQGLTQQQKDAENKLLSACVGHRHLRVIPSFTNFDETTKRLIDEAENVLIHHLETERAFIIERPSDEFLNTLEFCVKSEIEQCYITENGKNIRIRKRGDGISFIYSLTKKTGSGITRTELETSINESEYNKLKTQASLVLQKNRYCIVYDDLYYEMDTYPFSQEYARLEIELLNENQKITLPPFFNVLREVTANKAYSNKTLAATKKIEL